MQNKKNSYIFIVVLSTDDRKACLMVSGGLSQGFEIISNIDASEKWMLNTVFLVAGQNYCSVRYFSHRQKSLYFQWLRSGIWCWRPRKISWQINMVYTCVCGHFLLYLAIISIYIPE